MTRCYQPQSGSLHALPLRFYPSKHRTGIHSAPDRSRSSKTTSSNRTGAKSKKKKKKRHQSQIVKLHRNAGRKTKSCDQSCYQKQKNWDSGHHSNMATPHAMDRNIHHVKGRLVGWLVDGVEEKGYLEESSPLLESPWRETLRRNTREEEQETE